MTIWNVFTSRFALLLVGIHESLSYNCVSDHYLHFYIQEASFSNINNGIKNSWNAMVD